MTPIELVRSYFPGIEDADAETLLWEQTGFPTFFDGDPEAYLRAQLAALATKVSQ